MDLDSSAAHLAFLGISLLIFLHESIVHSFCLVSCSMRELTIDTICIFNYQLQGDTINQEIFVFKIFHAIIFRVKIFSYASMPYGYILTTKI